MNSLCGTAVVAIAVTAVAAPSDAGIIKFEDEASFLAAVSSPLHEDFDAFLSGELITSLPSVNVAAISGLNSQGELVSQFVTAQDDLPFPMLAGMDTSSPPNLFSNDLSADAHFATGTISFVFFGPMNAIGFFVADGSGLATFRIELFSGGDLVGVIHSDAPKTLPDSFLGVTSTIPFDAVTFGSDQILDSWGIDDLYTQIIPAPGALALLGLAGLMGRRRRR